MNRFRWQIALWLAAFLVTPPSAWAQRGPLGPRAPHVGYVYPAGGRQGAAFEVTLGGQYLNGATEAYVSGEGVQVTVGKYARPLNQKEVNQLRNKLQKARKRVQAEMKKKGKRFRRRSDYQKMFRKLAKEMGISAEELKAFEEFRKRRSDPKRQLNPQLAETVTLQVKLAADAEPGERELRLKTATGLSNPLCFHVGQFPEYSETEPNDKTADTGIQEPLPVILNGQILPGDVDRFRFEARKGERLVVAASARELIPYLADAVPGWFQATVALYDAQGNELAYEDDYRFHPDPVLYYEIPEEGQYVLEIKDAIYRGREDFVYRIALGEMPFVTSIFPLGGRDGVQTTVAVKGWNLPVDTLTLDADDKVSGIHPISVGWFQRATSRVPFAVDTLPESLEKEPNDDSHSAQRVKTPLIVNGRIDRPGDWDVFRFEGRAGDQVVAEVQARRLGSPLDSVIELTDANGRQLAANDDYEDKGAGLTTHQADSRLSVTIPADGTYSLRLGDTQHQGGTAYGYRLRISPLRPDFELRVVPSSINARAGAAVPITVYALRRDGFADDITLELKDAPRGFALSGGWIPAGQDKVRLTLTVPPSPEEEPFKLRLEGRALIQGREIRRPAVPAEDMMQAFIYHHLVPAKDLLVAVTPRGWFRKPANSPGKRQFRAPANFRRKGQFRAPMKSFGHKPMTLPAGGTARVEVPFPAGPFWDRVQLALSDPPEGVTVQKAPSGQGGVAILLRADAAKAKPGLKGNLIVDVFVARVSSRQGGNQRGNKRRIPLGTLPAIPFEIVEP